MKKHQKYKAGVLLGILLCTPAFAAKLTEVRVVDQEYLMVTVLDGEVTHIDDGKGTNAFTMANQEDADAAVLYAPALSTTAAQTATNWTITSATDANYTGAGKAPLSVARKTKLNGHAQLTWNKAKGDYNNAYTYTHTLYLKLPNAMQQGATYTLGIAPATNVDKTTNTITFDINTQVSEAIHVNLVGYHASNYSKAADLHIWLGDAGARDYTSFIGKKVYLYNTLSQTKTEVGAVSLWSQNTSQDAFWRDLTKSPVWKIDFTGASALPGTYRLVVDGVGASQDFKIGDDIYYEPFMTSLKGFFYMRIGQDSVGGIWPVPRRPLYIPGEAATKTVVYLTTMHPYHAEWSTLGGQVEVGADKWDQKHLWARYKKTGNPTNPNAKGGHSDAADWDRHLGHISIIYDMLLPYILTNGQPSDDNIGIPESKNGIPDILDEAQNEVDFWLNLRDGAAYSHGLGNPDSINEFFQAAPTAVAAWANAANSAMLADCFRIAGNATLSKRYQDSAVVAWNFASALADPMLANTVPIGDAIMTGSDLKMTAAAYLYNLTGDVKYETAMAAESKITSATSFLQSETEYNQLWAVAGYLKTTRTVNQQTLWNNMKASVIYQANNFEVANIASRASRRASPNGKSMGYYMTTQNMHNSMIAHAITADAGEKKTFIDAMVLEADYGLGRNVMNMIQMSTATTLLQNKRSVEELYTTGRDDGAAGMHPGQTPYLNVDNWWCTMVMGCPDSILINDYPDFRTMWPADEAYHKTRYIFAHSEFTPQQTMRGKMALYGYLYGIGTKYVNSIQKHQKPNAFIPGDYRVRILDLRGRTVWRGMMNLNQENDLLKINAGVKGLHVIQATNGYKSFTKTAMLIH